MIDGLIAITVIIMIIMVAFLPTYVASKRGHKNIMPIFICNIVGCFTGIFWIVALIWAFTDNVEK